MSFQSCDLSLTAYWVTWYWSRGAIGSFNCILEILKVQIGLSKVPLQSAVTWLEQKMIMWSNDDVIELIGIFITHHLLRNFSNFKISAEIKTRISVELREIEKFKISLQNLFTLMMKFWLLTRLGFSTAFWLVDRTVQKWTLSKVHSKICLDFWSNKKLENISWSIFRQTVRFRFKHFESFWGFLKDWSRI